MIAELGTIVRLKRSPFGISTLFIFSINVAVAALEVLQFMIDPGKSNYGVERGAGYERMIGGAFVWQQP